MAPRATVCWQCREGRHRLCESPKLVVTLSDFGKAKNGIDPDTRACCDEKIFWTQVVLERK